MKTSPFLAVALLLLACQLPAAPQIGGPYEPSVLRVRVTRQGYDFIRPWQKEPPEQVGGIGVVLAPDRILVPGGLLADATLVEVERIGDGSRCEATVESVDYAANLGLIRPKDGTFAQALKPLKIRAMAKQGDTVTAVQFEGNGTPSVSEGTIKSVDVTVPPGARSPLLVYRVTIELELGNTGITPFFRRGRLIGLMVGYDKSGRTATLIPSPVIQHFLADLEDGSYDGFPIAGFSTTTIRDPQLRRYLGIENSDPGVYVTQVVPGSPAAKAGLVKGDILVSIDHYTVDRHGQYDDPDYGPLALSYLISTRRQVGDQLPCTVRRDGKELDLTVSLDRMITDDYPVPPYINDRPPRFLIVGGFVFQQLSGPLLAIWGDEWETKAPRRLTRIARNQWDLFQPGEHAVVLTRTLPTPENIGYENLAFLTVDTVNGKAVKSVREVADAIRNAGPVEDHVVHFADPDAPDLVIPAGTMALADRFVRERYGIPQLMQLD